MLIYSADGVPLRDPAGKWWVTAEQSSARQGVTMRAADAAVPGLDGVLAPVVPERRESATLNLRIMCSSRDPQVREQAWEDVTSLFTLKRVVRLGRALSDVGPWRYALVKLRSISEPELSSRLGTLAGIVSVVILDGLFHSAPVDTTFSLTADRTDVLPGLDGTAPVDDWRVRVKGPLTSLSLTDQASGTGSTWAGALAADEWLFLTPASARVANSAEAWDSGGSETSGGISGHPSGLLSLTPARAVGGARSTTWTVTRTGSSAASEITLRAGAAWL